MLMTRGFMIGFMIEIHDLPAVQSNTCFCACCRMLVMHNNLLRRYEKELKANMTHVETITEFNVSAVYALNS